MDFTQLAQEAGCLSEAAGDIVRRCEAHFQGETPSPAVVKQWITTTLRAQAPELFPKPQRVWEKLGMSKEDFDKMPATWKLEQARLQHPQVTTPHPRRPVYRDLTEAELKALDAEGLSWADRHAKARALQQTPLPPP